MAKRRRLVHPMKSVLMQLVAVGPRDPRDRERRGGEGPRGGESDVIVGAKPTLTSHRVKVIRRNRIEHIKEGTVDNTAEKCTMEMVREMPRSAHFPIIDQKSIMVSDERRPRL